MVIISFKKVPIRNNSELFSISYLYCYFNIRYRNVHLTALFFYPMPLSEIPYFKAFPVVSFILLYWYGISGKLHFICSIEPVNGFQQADASNLKQILRLISSVCKSSHNTPDQSNIIKNDLLSCCFVSFFGKVDSGEAVWGKLNRLGLKENSVGYVDNDFFRENVPQEIRDKMAESQKKILNGEITVKSYYDFANEAEYQQLLDSVAP